MGTSQKRASQNYGEPWSCKPIPAYQLTFGENDSDPEVAVLAGPQRPVQIWANLGVPGEAECLVSLGEIVEFDGLRPVVQLHRLLGLRANSADHQAIAERIVACVNFCACADNAELSRLGTLGDVIDSCDRTHESQNRIAVNQSVEKTKTAKTRRKSK